MTRIHGPAPAAEPTPAIGDHKPPPQRSTTRPSDCRTSTEALPNRNLSALGRLKMLQSADPEIRAAGEHAKMVAKAMNTSKMAHSAVGFATAASLINGLPAGDRAEPLKALARNFEVNFYHLPIAALPEICDSVIDVLDRIPVDTESAAQVAQPLLSTFETIQHLQNVEKSDELLQDYAQAGTLSPAIGRAFEAATPAMLRLDKLVTKHGLQNDDNLVDKLTDACLRSGSQLGAQVGLMIVPKYMMKLDQARPDCAERALSALTSFAEATLGAQGIPLTGDLTWGPWVSGQIDKALLQHGLQAPPALEAAQHALKSLAND
jgi:hypothetical protein